MEKGFVFVTGYGLCQWKGYEQSGTGDQVQWKGQIKLPEGTTTADGKDWMELDHWFMLDEVFVTVEDAITAIADRFVAEV